MFSNYFKIAYRSLLRKKAFSAINIFGLAIGMATCLIILLFVMNELSYDRFNKKADRIFRVVFKGSVQGEKMREANIMPPTAATLVAEYPEVEAATRLRDFGKPKIVVGENVFQQDGFAYVDPNFFQVFTLPFVDGDPVTALKEPNTLVISERAAAKYFQGVNPIGKLLHFKSLNSLYKVTGVMKNIPEQSHFNFDLLGSMSTLQESSSGSWMTSNYYTYIVLQQGSDYKKLEAKLPQITEKYIGPQFEQALGMTLSEFRSKGSDIGLYLQPLTDIHLHSDLMFELKPPGNIRNVYLFTVIAIFMLLIACINFMNLSTAGATKRAREVGIRKVLGSEKKQLVRQFLFESTLLTSIALIIALVIVYLMLPVFNDIAGTQLQLNLFLSPWLIPALLLINLLVGFLAGSYPAFFIASFDPISVLKGKLTSTKNNLGIRSGLVVFQFFISITLIISTAVVLGQLRYMRNKELGYDREQVLVLPESFWLGNNADVFRNKLLQDPRILSVSTSPYLPAGTSNYNNFTVYGDDPSELIKTLRYEVDTNYVYTLGIRLLTGRNFSKSFPTDTTAIILNETAVKEFGWESPLGKTITHSDNEGRKTVYTVIGVVRDFNFKSLHEPISPLVMVLRNNSGSIIAKIKTTDIPALLATIKNHWRSFVTEEPFDYSFLDDRFNQSYQLEQRIGKILAIFSALTIFVACLGLFGLVMFSAEQRTKEIGIRKVLGASVTDMVTLLSKDFLKLVLIANLIAWPLSWWLMHKWLQDFAYRIAIPWWIFILAGITAMLIAIFTLSFQAIKAALMNPVKSLRTE